MTKFIEELDRPCYALRDKRGFFDKELPIAPELLDVLVEIDEKAQKAQLFLRTVYMGGDRPKIEVPAWLNDAANDRRRGKLGTPHSQKDSEVPSKLKSQKTLTLKA